MVKKILVVDDDKSIVRFLQEELQKRIPEVEVIATNSGLAALKTILAGSVDLLITDIAMPDIDGYELFLRAREIDDNLPVIMMTGFGYDPNHAVVNARRAGLDDVMFKPFDIVLLEKKVREKLAII